MIILLTAHQAEAKPWLRHYALVATQLNDGQTVFGNQPFDANCNSSEAICLLVTGQGVEQCRFSIGRLLNNLGDDAIQRWLNFGLAGSADIELGQLVRVKSANQIELPLVLAGDSSDVELVALHTVNKVETAFDYPGAYDMEGAAIAEIARDHGHLPSLEIIKLISDGPKPSDSQLQKIDMARLITSHAASITDLSDKLIAPEQP